MVGCPCQGVSRGRYPHEPRTRCFDCASCRCLLKAACDVVHTPLMYLSCAGPVAAAKELTTFGACRTQWWPRNSAPTGSNGSGRRGSGQVGPPHQRTRGRGGTNCTPRVVEFSRKIGGRWADMWCSSWYTVGSCPMPRTASCVKKKQRSYFFIVRRLLGTNSKMGLQWEF